MSDPGMAENMISFRDELLKHESVKASALSANMPGRTFGRAGIRPEGAMEDEDEMWIVSVFNYDEYYLDLMGMEIVAGRNFSPESGDEENGIMVNEAFVAQIGWEDPIGKQVRMGGGDQYRSVVGVVKDFHFADMKHVIEPLIMFYNPGANNNVSFRIGGGEIEATMQVAEGIWGEVYPEYPFEYEFFDEEFDQLYRSDERFSSLVMNFTWLAIFIACMGLFGLSAFMADQRKKEIGVRKVLGSSVQQVVLLLSREFMVLISIATLIAWPIAYFAVNNWLGEFQYRIELLSGANIVIFVVAGLVALGIGLLTVGYQSRAAAVINPVNSLKEE
jgi:putative ABC transport system permease protein